MSSSGYSLGSENDSGMELKKSLSCTIGIGGRLTWVSPDWGELSGIPTSRMSGRPLADFLHPDDVALISPRLDTPPGAADLVDQFEARIRLQDGDYLPMHWTVSSTLDSWFAHAVSLTPTTMSPDLIPDASRQLLIVLHCMTNALVVINHHGVIQFINDRTFLLLEYTTDDLVGQDVGILWPPDQAAFWRADLASFRRKGISRATLSPREVTVLTKSNRPVSVDLKVTQYVEPDGEVFFALLMRDITSELFARRALADSQRRLAFCFERAIHPVCLGDIRGQVLEANDRFVELSGYSRGDLVKSGWMTLIHPDDLGGVLHDISNLSSTDDSQTTRVVRMCSQDGNLGWIDASSGFVDMDPDGTPIPVVALADVTYRENTLRSLENAQSRLRDAFERSLVGQGIFDLDGRFTAVNSALALMLGCSIPDLIGTQADRFVHPEDLARTHKAFGQFRSRQLAGWRSELRLVGCADQTVQALVLASASFDQAGQPTQVLVQVEDISAQKQLLEAITRSNTDLQRFAHLASHDLQAPLRTIRGYADLLIDSFDQSTLSEEQIDLVDKITESASDMQSLIRDLLAVCRVDLDPSPPQPTPLTQAFHQAVSRLESDIEHSGASVSCAQACQAAVLIDPSHLVMIMQNLIQNAISHRVPDWVPEVTTSCGPAGNMIEIRVADNGPGIEESMRERVFEMFVKDSRAGGTGIGLALVKRIVENAKGEVRIEDNKPGTVVIVTLPAAPNPDGLACSA